MNILLPAVLIMAMAGTAAANSKLLILHSEGRADAKTRAKVDAAIVKLAKTGPDTVTPGEITFSDAAAMVGCRTEDPACAREVATTLAVDELVIVTVTPKPPGYEVHVRRTGKGVPKHAAATVPADKLDQLDVLAPVFGGKAPDPAPPPVKPVGPEPPPAVTTTPPITDPPVTKPADKPAPSDLVPDLTPLNANEPPKTTPLQPTDKQPKDRRRLYLTGMIGGGGMVFLGVILWATASGVQGQIDEAPTRTRADLQNLQDLEGKADGLAGWGNFFAVGGLIVGGVSTYFYIKNQRAKKQRSRTAWIAPTLFDRGVGVTLSLGGMP